MNKYNALIQYQYHFNCENSYLLGYFTEKIVAPILSECLCFYSGCPDISNIIQEDSIIQLHLDDPEKSFWIVCDSTNNNLYQKKIVAIRKSKQALITDLNPINRIRKKLPVRKLLFVYDRDRKKIKCKQILLTKSIKLLK